MDADPAELVRSGYNAISGAYRSDDDPAHQYGPWLASLLGRIPGQGQVLDIGCGCGVPVARRLAAAGHQVTGVDISDVQVERARQLVPGAIFLRADATGAGFPPGSFDAVVCLYALIHMPLDRQPPLLRDIARWLRPGGWLLAVTGQDAWTGTEDNWLGGTAPMWWSQADAATYRTWLTQAGLEVTSQQFVPEGDGGHALFWAQRHGETCAEAATERPRFMDDKLHFATDLYQGTAEYYDRYRLPYPEAMTEDLIARAGVSGHGRLLDLACGTGQLAFPLRRSFAEVWAVDREPDFTQMVQAKAHKLGAGNIRPVTADAETLDAEPGHFELAVIGNAFHRLDRDLVAARLLHWLQPGGCMALCWADTPQLGDRQWQMALAALLRQWQTALGAAGRVPANWAEPQRRRPDAQVLSEAGFETAGRHEFPVEHRWSLAELAGYVRSTSFLPPSVLGDQGAAFDNDLAATMNPFAAADGTFPHDVGFVYELARKPTD